MANEKSIVDLTLADLKSAADFVDDGIPVPSHDHDRSVSAGRAAVASESKAVATTKLSIEELLAMNATAEGRARVAALLGVVNSESNGDEIIDIPPEHRAERDDLARRVGGEDKIPEIERRYDEANTIFDLDSELDDRPFASAAERNQAALKLVAMVDAVLANPALAAKELMDFFARDPNADPVMKAYLAGDGNVGEMVAKLSQAAHGEKPVGRQKPVGDGHIY